MQVVVRAAVAMIAGAQCAGITMVSDLGEITTSTKTDDLLARIDELQSETGQGPCLSTAREHLTVQVDDLRTERRWPRFAAAAARAGAGSMLCLQLFVRGDSLGALNLLSREPGAFDEASVEVGLLLASHAAIAMADADRAGDLAASGRELQVALASQAQTVARLHVLDGLKHTVLQTLAHDLRGPIATVLTLAGVLRSGLPTEHGTSLEMLSQQQLELLSDIERSAQKMKRLLHDLISADPLLPVEARRSACDLADLVTRVLADNALARSHPMNISLDSVVVHADAAQVERIVDNLLSNAAKHLDASVAMWVRTESVGPGALITVEDAGPGVPADLRNEIFEPFRRGTETTQPGLGLGLSLVSRYAQIHDGHAWVEERKGGGASFRVYLPDTATDEPPHPQRATPAAVAAIRVLICDDDPILSDALATLIRSTPGLELVAPPAQSGPQVIDAVSRYHPDVVVMDVNLMGLMDGFEATARIRAMSPTTSVVIMSGTTRQERARLLAEQAGASTYLVKAGSNADLITAIHAAVPGRSHRTDRAHPTVAR